MSSEREPELLAILLDPTADSGDLLGCPLPDAEAAAAVDALKEAADKYRGIDPHISIKFAQRIIAIGAARGDKWQIALGRMAEGDARKFTDRLDVAWDILAGAGDLFREVGDEVGWARTWIGRLLIAVNVGRVEEALAAAARAYPLLEQAGQYDRVILLEINRAIVYDLLGAYDKALEVLAPLADLNEKWPTRTDHRAMIYSGMASAHSYQGDLPGAIRYYTLAQDHYMAQGQTQRAASGVYNLAYAMHSAGRFQEALTTYHRVIEAPTTRENTRSFARRSAAECYLDMNRFAEALTFAEQAAADFRNFQDEFETARTVGYIALAQAQLGNYEEAHKALDEAEATFARLDSVSWLALTHLRRALIYLKAGQSAAACPPAEAALQLAQGCGSAGLVAQIQALCGRIALERGDGATAVQMARGARDAARRLGLAAVRFDSHQVLARAAEAQGQRARAVRHYRAAVLVLESQQRHLTLTLRPTFLEDKIKPQRALVRLWRAQGNVRAAFEALEGSKARLLLEYAFNRDRLHWSPENGALVERLEAQRAEYQMLYRQVFGMAEGKAPAGDTHEIERRRRLSKIERELRQTTERLYLRQAGEGYNPVHVPDLEAIAAALPAGAVLIAFDVDENGGWWAYTLAGGDLCCFALPVRELESLIEQVYANLDHAVSVVAGGHGNSRLGSLSRRLTGLLQQIYRGLLAPLAGVLAGARRLIFVPQGVLHTLPFNLLHDGARYLIEGVEVVTLPAAALLTRPPEARDAGALALAFDHPPRAEYAEAEARLVHELFGGALLIGEAATRAAFRYDGARPQILHIAAHGAYRFDEPSLSHVELADGQVFTDDLIQGDMGYALVTLSACETGRGRVMQSDEIIGLGRGLLYAGAQSLLMSLWRVEDHATLRLMEAFYRGLAQGQSKGAALRHAQVEMLQMLPEPHPLLWGAFQLIGNAEALSPP